MILLNYVIRRWQWFFLCIVVIFLSLIRLHNFERVPSSVHAEELLYGWSGIHLVERGVPRSWSTLNYGKQYLQFSGQVGDPRGLYLWADLYEPWVDEPPLFSLIVGSVAHWYGADRDMVVPSAYMRLPVVLTSLMTMFFVFLLGYRVSSYWVGLLAMLIYGSSPLIVFASRLAVPENMIAFGLLLSTFFYYGYQKHPGWRWPLLMSVLTLALGLMKPTGFFIAFLGMFWMIQVKQWKHVLLLGGSLSLGIGLFLLYGYYWDWDLFVRIVTIQGGRFAGWTGMPYIFATPAYDIFEFFDGWYILSMLLSVWAVLSGAGGDAWKPVRMVWIYWVLVAVFSGTEQDLLPWYWFATFPFTALLGGLMLSKMIQKAEFVHVVFVVGMLLSSRWYLHNDFRPTSPPWSFRIVFFVLVSSGLAALLWKKGWINGVTRGIMVLVIVSGVFLNVRYIYSAFEIRCESISCPIGPSTAWTEVRVPFFWRWLSVGDSAGLLTEKRPWL